MTFEMMNIIQLFYDIQKYDTHKSEQLVLPFAILLQIINNNRSKVKNVDALSVLSVTTGDTVVFAPPTTFKIWPH